MNTAVVDTDERTIAVANASYFWGYLVLSFGLLLLVAYRSFFHQEAPWDLMALVILGGVVTSAYQGFHKVLTRHWVVKTVVMMAFAALIAALIAASLTALR